MPILRLLLLCFSFTWAIIPPAQSLTLGVEITNYSPYYYLDNKQQYQGAAREVFDLFTRVNTLKIRYSPMPVPRLFNEFVKGTVDLKFPDNPLWSASLHSDVKVFYSESIFSVRESLLVLKQEGVEIPKQEIKKVGTILGFSLPGIAKEVANKEFETIQTQEIDQLIHMLAAKRVEGVYFNESVALDLAKKLYPKMTLAVHSQYPAFNYAYHLSSIKHPELVTSFNQFLISHAEQVAEIRRRYGLK